MYRKSKFGSSHSEPVGGGFFGVGIALSGSVVQPLAIAVLSTKAQYVAQIIREATIVSLYPNNISDLEQLMETSHSFAYGTEETST